MTRILILQGHPDGAHDHLCHALAEAYADGASRAGHDLRQLNVAALDLPPLASKRAWDTELPQPAVRMAQEAIGWAEHLVIVYPLWLGCMPARLKGFFEQVFRPGFAMMAKAQGNGFRPLLSGRSARVIVTMAMPALVYRLYFRAHSLKLLQRNILGFVGISPHHSSVVGNAEGLSASAREEWVRRARELGGRAG